MMFKRINGRLVNINHIVEIEAVLSNNILEDIVSKNDVKTTSFFINIKFANNEEESIEVRDVNLSEILETKEFKSRVVVNKNNPKNITNEDIVSTSIFEYFNTYLKEKYENDFVQKYIEGER